jgi:hypothetical protein
VTDTSINKAGIHPAPKRFTDEQIAADGILQFFHYEHLPEKLQAASKPFCDLAFHLVSTLPHNPERTVALRKLLEAKDASVQANVVPSAKAETFMDRLVAEREELNTRHEKLVEFLNGEKPGVSLTQVSLLRAQAYAMNKYLRILNQRISDTMTARIAEPDTRSATSASDLAAQRAGSELDTEFPEVRETGDHDEDRQGPVPFTT